METGKKQIIVALAIVLSVLCTACDWNGRTVAGYSGVLTQSEVEELAEQLEALSSANISLRKDLYQILLEMDNLAGEAFALERERERNGAIQNQAVMNRINARLESVKRQLADAKRQAGENPALQATIRRLQESITAQEKQIRHLKSVIKSKDAELQQAYDQLKTKNEELEVTNTQIISTIDELTTAQVALQEQTFMTWQKAGDELVNSARMIPEVRKHGPMIRKVRAAKQRILLKAIDCYSTARHLGSPSATSKIDYAQSLLNKIQQGINIGEETI